MRYALFDKVGTLSSSLHKSKVFAGSLDLPGFVRNFYELTKDFVSWSLNDIIQYHTLFPLYEPFLTSDKREKVKKAMICGYRRSIHASAGIISSGLSRSKYPWYCPACAKESLKEFGEAYFKRIHQVPNIGICPIHSCKLIELRPKVQDLWSYQFKHLNEEITSIKSSIPSNCNTLLSLGKTFQSILADEGRFDINELEYTKVIRDLRYFVNGRVKRKEICAEFRGYYRDVKDPFIFDLVDSSKNWVSGVLTSPTKTFNPYKHLLVWDFINDLRPIRIERLTHPFGSGPWQCYNKAATHYLTPVVKKMELHEEKTNGRTICEFTCECGMVYVRSFTRGSGEKSNPRFWIKERGKVWASKLEDLLKVKGVSLRKMAGQLGIHASNLKKIIAKRNEGKPNIKLDNQLKMKRESWKKILLQHRSDGIVKIRKGHGDLYAWLYRHDRKWLIKTNEGNRIDNQLRLRLDWEELDAEICKEIPKAVNYLEKEGYNRRITKTVIAKVIDKGNYILSNRLSKLPRTRAYLSIHAESTCEFHEKRLRKAMKEMQRSGDTITLNKLVRKAGICRPKEEVMNILKLQSA